MNLESKLNESLNDVLKSSGYIFEIINNNRKQSNLITGSNNQLISPAISLQLSNSINKFDEILDETVSKFNDAKWCVEQILENKQKQEELKLKEEIERQKRKAEEERRRKEEEERRRKEEEERRRKEEEEKAAAAAAAEKARQEEQIRLAREKEENERRQNEENERKRQEEYQKRQQQEQQQQQQQQQSNNDINDFMTDGFDFDMGDLGDAGDKGGLDIPNPSDILSSISYNGAPDLKNENPNPNPSNNNNDNSNNKPNANDLDLDMNNLLGNDELILDGLNMNILDQGYANDNPSVGNDMNAMEGEEEFDVDNFLNQFGGGD